MSPDIPAALADVMELTVPEQPVVVDWAGVFGRSAPMALEIGTGNGVYLAVEAGREPGTNFIGIERCDEFFIKFKKRMIREGRANVRCFMAEAEDVIDRMIADRSLTRVIILHSDPWPKRRHRGRRVFRPDFMDRIERILIPGGTLEFQHDVGWYFNLTVNLMRQRPGWSFEKLGPVEPPEPESGGIQTNFEARARREGTRIWGFVARWSGGAGATEG